MLQMPSLLSEIDVLEKTFVIENMYIWPNSKIL